MAECQFDRELFLEVCHTVRSTDPAQYNIGTLSEKTLHRVLKSYFANGEMIAEAPVNKYVADLLGDSSIIEIQTNTFSGLRDKLQSLLKLKPVVLVYPIAQKKWIHYIQSDSGEVSERKRSPKTGRITDVFPEMMFISRFLIGQGLTIRVVLLEIEEYRTVTNTLNRYGKPCSIRYDRVPTDIFSVYDFCDVTDYAELIPLELDSVFTKKELMNSLHMRTGGRRSSAASYVLQYVGAIEQAGKNGNSYLYRKKTQTV